MMKVAAIASVLFATMASAAPITASSAAAKRDNYGSGEHFALESSLSSLM